MDKIITIESILIGQVKTLKQSKISSAIAKTPVARSVEVTRLGLRGDEQADEKHHGGIDKAIHHYPWDHYSFWRTVPDIDREVLSVPGAFGENLSSTGLLETDLCIGDILTLGSATLQVSQGRQPCSKLNLRFGKSSMMDEVLRTAYTGWYYRVLDEGMIRPGDGLRLKERRHPDWTIRDVFKKLFHQKDDVESLQKIVSMTELADSWKELAMKLLKRQRV